MKYDEENTVVTSPNTLRRHPYQARPLARARTGDGVGIRRMGALRASNGQQRPLACKEEELLQWRQPWRPWTLAQCRLRSNTGHRKDKSPHVQLTCIYLPASKFQGPRKKRGWHISSFLHFLFRVSFFYTINNIFILSYKKLLGFNLLLPFIHLFNFVYIFSLFCVCSGFPFFSSAYIFW